MCTCAWDGKWWILGISCTHTQNPLSPSLSHSLSICLSVRLSFICLLFGRLHNYLWRCHCHCYFHWWNTAIARWTKHLEWQCCRLWIILWLCYDEFHRTARLSCAAEHFCRIRVHDWTVDVGVDVGVALSDRFPPAKSHAQFESVLIGLKYLMNDNFETNQQQKNGLINLKLFK